MKIRIVPKTPVLDKAQIRAEIMSLFEADFKSALAKKHDKGYKPVDKKPVFPMDYVLFKFPNLKTAISELLTITFRDYIKNIYVIAPKPTTFKVMLKNEQFFFLIYDDTSYQAKVLGKKYYLINLGDKERAIKAIADLLATKKFITSKEDTADGSGPDSEESKGGSKKKSSGGGSSPAGGLSPEEYLAAANEKPGEGETPGGEPANNASMEVKPEDMKEGLRKIRIIGL